MFGIVYVEKEKAKTLRQEIKKPLSKSIKNKEPFLDYGPEWIYNDFVRRNRIE